MMHLNCLELVGKQHDATSNLSKFHALVRNDEGEPVGKGCLKSAYSLIVNDK